MDNAILKKKLNTFKAGESGRLQEVGSEVVMEVLRTWENWPGKCPDLCRELGLSRMQLVTMIQKAKRLVKGGVVQESEFKEVAVAGTEAVGLRPCVGIELVWGEGKIIRFPGVEPLLDFLKKAA
jgi:hypothetical protein